MNQKTKTAEILCVGTELLMGNTVNTNATAIARGLAEVGLNLYHQGVVGDNPQRLQEAVELALSRSDFIITTGGLGPTYDDLTRLLGRNEDVLWFEDGRGNREFLHPLAIEGFCIEGLKDYQFRQTAKDTFEMYAETGSGVSREQIRQEMLLRMRKILAEKRLDYVQFYVNFVEEILPDIRTGKKPLICASNEPSAVLARAFGECRGSQQPAGLLT